MTGAASFVLTRRGAVATIRMTRPAALDAHTPVVVAELLFLLEQARREAGAVVLVGLGERFLSDAADLAADKSAASRARARRAALRAACDPILQELRDAPIAVVAAVEGAASGGGCAIALACDMIIVGESASFAAPARCDLGRSDPATASRMRGAARAQVFVPPPRASSLSAREAHRCGLVNQVAPDGAVAAFAELTAERLVTIPRPELQAIKQVCRAGAERIYRTCLGGAGESAAAAHDRPRTWM